MSKYHIIRMNDGDVNLVRCELTTATEDPLTTNEVIIDELVQSKTEMLAVLIDAYKGVIDDPSILVRIIEKNTGQKIEELI